MSARFARLEQLAESALASGLGSAVAISVGDRGEECFQLSRGHLWRVPALGPQADAQAWFDLASLTKPLATVALCMRLVERGELALARPVQYWVGTARTTGTVAHLLGHAAGCAPHVKFFERLDQARRQGEAARQALVRLAAEHPLEYEPGARTVYSDLGYLLLGHVVEQAGQAELDALFAREVAAPLELGAHFTPVPGARPYVGTEVEGGSLVCGVVHDENARAGGGVHGHAGLFGRIEDVARLARAFLAPPRDWLSMQTVEQFFSSSAGPGSWRLGWDTPSLTLGVSHAGDRWPRQGAVGHLGFTGTSLWLALPQRRWVALLTNRVHPSREGSAEGIKDLRRAVMDEAWRALEPT